MKSHILLLSPGLSMSVADKYQQQLLEKAQYLYHETPIGEATKQAYLATPRHLSDGHVYSLEIIPERESILF
jgi:hypothetical protein